MLSGTEWPEVSSEIVWRLREMEDSVAQWTPSPACRYGMLTLTSPRSLPRDFRAEGVTALQFLQWQNITYEETFPSVYLSFLNMAHAYPDSS